MWCSAPRQFRHGARIDWCGFIRGPLAMSLGDFDGRIESAAAAFLRCITGEHRQIAGVMSSAGWASTMSLPAWHEKTPQLKGARSPTARMVGLLTTARGQLRRFSVCFLKII